MYSRRGFGVVSWKVVLSKQAAKDAKKIKACGLSQKAKELINTLQNNPYQPPSEKLVGNLRGYYSRRINIQHLVYDPHSAPQLSPRPFPWAEMRKNEKSCS